VLVKCTNAEDIAGSEDFPTATLVERYTSLLRRAWILHGRRRVGRVFSAVSAVLSASIALGELAVFFYPPLSFVRVFVNTPFPFFNVVACYLFLGYMIATCVWSIAQIRVAGLFGLYPSQTDGATLVWAASIVSRLAPPLCFHFCALGNITAAGFTASLAPMETIPGLGHFNRAFAASLCVFVALQISGLYGQLLALFGLQSLDFDVVEDASPEDGKSIVARVRAERGKAREMRRVPSAKGNLSAKGDLESGVTGLSE
jgi:hypothetical protein